MKIADDVLVMAKVQKRDLGEPRRRSFQNAQHRTIQYNILKKRKGSKKRNLRMVTCSTHVGCSTGTYSSVVERSIAATFCIFAFVEEATRPTSGARKREAFREPEHCQQQQIYNLQQQRDDSKTHPFSDRHKRTLSFPHADRLHWGFHGTSPFCCTVQL
jgi:tRNA U55 pseudouridine synthase TruB